jgi:hypothetical protein
VLLIKEGSEKYNKENSNELVILGNIVSSMIRVNSRPDLKRRKIAFK